MICIKAWSYIGLYTLQFMRDSFHSKRLAVVEKVQMKESVYAIFITVQFWVYDCCGHIVQVIAQQVVNGIEEPCNIIQESSLKTMNQ